MPGVHELLEEILVCPLDPFSHGLKVRSLVELTHYCGADS